MAAHGRHIGEFLIRLYRLVRAATLALPRVINIDVGPTVIHQPGSDEGSRGTQHLLLIHRGGPTIPTIPTQRRRQRDFSPTTMRKRFSIVPLALEARKTV